MSEPAQHAELVRRLRMMASQVCAREALACIGYDGYCAHCWAAEQVRLIDGSER